MWRRSALSALHRSRSRRSLTSSHALLASPVPKSVLLPPPPPPPPPLPPTVAAVIIAAAVALTVSAVVAAAVAAVVAGWAERWLRCRLARRCARAVTAWTVAAAAFSSSRCRAHHRLASAPQRSLLRLPRRPPHPRPAQWRRRRRRLCRCHYLPSTKSKTNMITMAEGGMARTVHSCGGATSANA